MKKKLCSHSCRSMKILLLRTTGPRLIYTNTMLILRKLAWFPETNDITLFMGIVMHYKVLWIRTGEPGQIKGFSHFLKIGPEMVGHLVKAMHTSLVILLYMYMFKIVTSVMKWSVYVTGVDVFSCILYIITITIIF